MRKVISALFFMILSTNVFAGNALMSNQECVDIYRKGYLNLKESVRQFNDEYSNRIEFSAEVAANSTAVSAFRAVCLAVESPSNLKCVEAYKDLYQELRSKIRLGSVLSGNQTHISYTVKMQKIMEEEKREVHKNSFWNNIKRSLKLSTATVTETLRRARSITMLELIDQKCRN